MAQHLNLYDPARRPKAPPLNFRQGLQTAAATFALTAALAGGLHWQAGREQARAAEMQARLQQDRAARAPLSSQAHSAAELAQLRALDAQQRRVRAALSGPAAAGQDGYGSYFSALARQAHPALWITGFAVSGDGAAFELNGRMVDAGVLPDYLRRLNQESLFKGRPFAALDLKTIEGREEAAQPAVTEFALRTQPGRLEALR